MDWQSNIITTREGMRELLETSRRVAVLGIRSERYADRPAHYVPAYLASAGLEVIPVPVQEQGLQECLGARAYATLAEIPGEIDIVNVFRRPEHIPQHVEDILAKRPKAVWLQSGIRNDAVAEQLARAGIKVIQDRCLMVEHRDVVRGRQRGA